MQNTTFVHAIASLVGDPTDRARLSLRIRYLIQPPYHLLLIQPNSNTTEKTLREYSAYILHTCNTARPKATPVAIWHW